MKFLAAPDYQSMSRRAANLISAQVILFPNSVLGLATGSTPLGIYRQLADWYDKGDIDFSAVRTVNLDEYCGLAPEQVQSYHYYMKSNFFSKINVDGRNTNLPNGMAADLNENAGVMMRSSADWGIDLQILGIGHTGHIGFNEPGFAFDQTTHVVELNKKTIEANARF
ncbi:MAG: glucosamine-6-phosphate deaminase [Hydrogeniiclostridium mannosilyticum]